MGRAKKVQAIDYYLGGMRANLSLIAQLSAQQWAAQWAAVDGEKMKSCRQ